MTYSDGKVRCERAKRCRVKRCLHKFAHDSIAHCDERALVCSEGKVSVSCVKLKEGEDDDTKDVR